MALFMAFYAFDLDKISWEGGIVYVIKYYGRDV